LDANEIKELIDLISKSNFVSFELEHEGFKLKLEKGGGAVPAPQIVVTPAPVAAALPPTVASASPPSGPVAVVVQPLAPAAEAAPAASGLVDMASPIVGTFYRQPGPGAPPFVEPGSRVRKGQVLCIIEAMKLMNEIEAEIEAEVVEVLVANGQAVEFGEVLFRLRPLAS